MTDSNPYAPPSELRSEDSAEPAALRDTPELPVDAKKFDRLEFVLNTLHMLHVVARSRNLTASDICRMVLQLAYDVHHGQPETALRDLGLDRSEKVSEAIAELVDLGLVRRHADDSPADFDGLYDLAAPRETWRVCWTTEEASESY